MTKKKPVQDMSPEELEKSLRETPFVSPDAVDADPDKDIILTPLSKKTAAELLTSFLTENNMELKVSPVADNIKTVSDGSLILSTPKIIAEFKKNG